MKNRIDEILKEKHMSRKELALRAGTTEVSIGRYINGKRKMKIDTACIIARCLGVTLNDLFIFSEV